MPRSTTPPTTSSSHETTCSYSNNWSKRRKLWPGCNIHIQFFFLTWGWCQLVTNKCVNEWHMELLLRPSVHPSIIRIHEPAIGWLFGCSCCRKPYKMKKQFLCCCCWYSHGIFCCWYSWCVYVCVCVVAHAVVPVVVTDDAVCGLKLLWLVFVWLQQLLLLLQYVLLQLHTPWSREVVFIDTRLLLLSLLWQHVPFKIYTLTYFCMWIE